MEFTDYSQIIDIARTLKTRAVVAVAGAADAHAIEAVLEAKDNNIAEPFLVGDKSKIKEILKQMGRNPADFRITSAFDGLDEGETAVELIKSGDASFLMKGMMETSAVLRPVVKKENNLRTGRGMSHLCFHHLPGYHKLICTTDGGMVTSPTLAQKKDILYNALDSLRKLGYENPKAACVCCKETVDEKIPATTDARALALMAQDGELGACTVVGPISYDIAMSAEIAALKRFDCDCAGDFDILLVPDIHSGNMLSKSWILQAGATIAGVIIGARIPIVLTSRGSGADEKLNSLALAAVLASKE